MHTIGAPMDYSEAASFDNPLGKLKHLAYENKLFQAKAYGLYTYFSGDAYILANAYSTIGNVPGPDEGKVGEYPHWHPNQHRGENGRLRMWYGGIQ